MKRKHYIIISSIIVIILIVIFSAGKEEKTIQLETIVAKGEFKILVTTTGELQAKNSEDIKAPQELRRRELRFGNIKIENLVPEGTLVDSGDFVASLDRTEATNKLKDVEDELQKDESQYTKTKLDTTMQLRNLRDELINLEFAMEERQIVVEQSKFEPPATQRQAAIDLDKAKRGFEQAKNNYELKVQQAVADILEVTINLSQQRRKLRAMEDVISRFDIMAPKNGMVIYKKEWNGQKRKVGSTISPWNLSVATLPDLSEMISKTYVNEIDISKVKVGQKVEVGVDAFPDNIYTGEVTEVANIGEQLPNSDAKVFEVVIRVNESDPILRPSMTTSNSILISALEDVINIPIEAIHNNDSLSFVYAKSGSKQIVILGEENENQIIIEAGLEEGDKIYLSVPEKVDKFEFKGLELIELARHKKQENIYEERNKLVNKEKASKNDIPEKMKKKAKR